MFSFGFGSTDLICFGDGALTAGARSVVRSFVRSVGQSVSRSVGTEWIRQSGQAVDGDEALA